jgi:hypothetical protein
MNNLDDKVDMTAAGKVLGEKIQPKVVYTILSLSSIKLSYNIVRCLYITY